MLKNFRYLKLKTMIRVLLFGSIIFLMLSEVTIRQRFYDKYNQLLYEKNEQMLITYSDYLETLLVRVENLTYSIIGDALLQENLTYLRDYYYDDANYSMVVTSVKNRLYNYVSQEPYFASFIFTSDNMEYRDGTYFSLKDEKFEEYINVAKAAEGQICWIPQEQGLLLSREVRKSENLEFSNLGYIVAQIDFCTVLESMNTTLKHMNMKGNVAVFFGDTCVYANTEGLDKYKKLENGWFVDGDNFYSVYKEEKRGYTMVISNYYGEVQQMIRETYWRSLIASVTVACIILVISNYFANQIIKELHLLMQRMDAFGKGIMPEERERMQYERMSNEIGKMYRHFYNMTVNYKKLSEEDYNNKLLLKEAELNHMQKQMQPHFILNALSIIRWKAHALKDNELTNIVDSLGRVVRSYMQRSSVEKSRNSIMTSVKNEIGMVEDYLYIQQFRFQERLKVQIELSENAMNMKIPRFCIQPLVENSIAYAMDEMISECQIKIYDRITETAMEIVVEDNGDGFEENILEEMDSGTIKPRGNGTALRNIQKRLQYSFSADYGLEFKKMDNGMQVIIRIPKGE